MTMIINILKKILKSGFDLIWQEKLITFVSLGTTIIVALFIWFGFLSFYFFNQMINFLQERLDFSIYFKPEVSRNEILKVQKILQNFPNVTNVYFVTQEEALERFKKETRTNPVITRALSELNLNPLVDYLIVKAKEPEVYPKVIEYLEKSPYKAYIDYVSYYENQRVIERIIVVSNKMRLLISVFVIFVLVLSGLVIFNVILVSVYSQKETIEVLRLIGASNFFIRGPFLVYSFLISFVGYLIFLALLIVFLDRTENFWPTLVSNFQPISFIYDNFFILNGLGFGIILLINWIGSLLALQKYLRV